jgi:hypothetical protein
MASNPGSRSDGWWSSPARETRVEGRSARLVARGTGEAQRLRSCATSLFKKIECIATLSATGAVQGPPNGARIARAGRDLCERN